MKYAYLSLVLVLVLACGSSAEKVEMRPVDPILPPYLVEYDSSWVDSVYLSLSFREKLGQLFMPYVYSNKGQSHIDKQLKMIQKYPVGGFIWMQGTPRKQMQYYNQLQDASKVPLMFSIDAERGLAMRLDSTHQFPYQMTMGALANDSLVYEVGKMIAEHCRKVGAHINFGPVVDVNNNPRNPIINIRSFGARRENVAQKGIAYMKGMQDERVLACAKHFPGHGDTEQDSHLTLPKLNFDSSRMDSLELFPFKKMIDSGVGSIMAAHLHIPIYDSTADKAASLSQNVIGQLLRKDLKFKGISFTDALNMKGVSKYYKPGAVELEALKAGNDVLLFSENIPEAFKVIEQALLDSVIDSSVVEAKALKILKLKSWLKIEDTLRAFSDSLFDYSAAQELNDEVFSNAPFVLRNSSSIDSLELYQITCKSKYARKNFGFSIAELDKIKGAIDSTKLLVIYGSPFAANLFPEVANIAIAFKKTSASKKSVMQRSFLGNNPL